MYNYESAVCRLSNRHPNINICRQQLAREYYDKLVHDKHKLQLDQVAQKLIWLLKKAKTLAKVVIVTNAETGWIELSCKAWLSAALPEVLIYHCIPMQIHDLLVLLARSATCTSCSNPLVGDLPFHLTCGRIISSLLKNISRILKLPGPILSLGKRAIVVRAAERQQVARGLEGGCVPRRRPRLLHHEKLEKHHLHR